MFIDAAVLISLNTWLFIGSVPAGGWLAEHFRLPNALMISGFIIFGLTLLFLPYGPALFLVLIMGIWGGFPAGPIMALPAGVLKPENRAVGMGLFYTITYAGMAALPAVPGWTLDITHSPNAPVLFGAGLVFFCILLLKIFHVFRKQYLK